MSSIKNISRLCLIAAAAGLAACGGSDNNFQDIKIGEMLSIEVSDSLGNIDERSFKVHGVTTEGALVDIEDDKLIPGKQVLIAYDEPNASTDSTEVKEFHQAIWKSIASYFGTDSYDDVIDQIGDFNLDLETLYLDYKKSNLNIDEYFSFYEEIDKFIFFEDQDSTEEELMHFLQNANANPRILLDVLSTQEMTWRNLLELLSERKQSFANLEASYNLWSKEQAAPDLSKFLASYINSTAFVIDNSAEKKMPRLSSYTSASAAGDASIDAGGASAVNNGIAIAKMVWQFIKDNKPEIDAKNFGTSALSDKDTNPMNYYGSKFSRPDQTRTTIKFKNKVKGVVAETTFSLSGHYGAEHASIPGQWVPSVSFIVDEAKASWGQKLNMSAQVMNIANAGQRLNPIPEFMIVATSNNKNFLYNRMDVKSYLINGASGVEMLK